MKSSGWNGCMYIFQVLLAGSATRLLSRKEPFQSQLAVRYEGMIEMQVVAMALEVENWGFRIYWIWQIREEREFENVGLSMRTN